MTDQTHENIDNYKYDFLWQQTLQLDKNSKGLFYCKLTKQNFLHRYRQAKNNKFDNLKASPSKKYKTLY